MTGSDGKRVTIRDVAAAAGVSKSLVSWVYSNPSRVSDESRALVLATAERLGFRPNWAARSLNAANGGFTGILMADLHSPPFAQLVDVARFELRSRQRLALMTAANAATGLRASLDNETLGFFGDLRPRSLIVVGSTPDMSSVAPLVESIPSVLAGGIDDALPFAATVRSDDAEGMRLLVGHLRARGHRSIAHIGGAGGPVGESRARGYATAMREAGLETEVMIEVADFSEAAGYAAARRLLERRDPPTAITAINDVAAAGALAAVAGTGTAVTGYGDTAIAGYRLTQLTTVRAHNDEIGRRAVEALIGAEEHPDVTGREVLVSPSLVVRGTT